MKVPHIQKNVSTLTLLNWSFYLPVTIVPDSDNTREFDFYSQHRYSYHLGGKTGMPNPQPGIIDDNRQFALFLVANVKKPHRDGIKVARQCAVFFNLMKELTDAKAGMTGTVSYGSDFWDAISPKKRPALLAPLKAVGKGARKAPNTGGDLLVHISSNRVDLNFELARRLCLGITEYIEVLEEVHGFTYLDGRDLTGFIDGTANPKLDERAKVALINKDRNFQGGSYVLTQKYVHDLKKWQKLTQKQQENIIGRHKPDSEELAKTKKLPTAHISRVEIEERGEELKVVRHSYPYGKASGKSGLFFIAYASEPETFEKMLAKMFGVSGDGLHDHLMDYTRPKSGAVFFTPSREVLESFK